MKQLKPDQAAPHDQTLASAGESVGAQLDAERGRGVDPVRIVLSHCASRAAKTNKVWAEQSLGLAQLEFTPKPFCIPHRHRDPGPGAGIP